MPPSFLFVTVCLLAIVLLSRASSLSDLFLHSLWSASPLEKVTITTNDGWVDVPNTLVQAVLALPTTVLISYCVTVFPQLASLPSTGGLAIIDETRAPGSDDLLAFRVVVDSFAARQSGASTGYFQTEASLVSGYWATPLSAGNHSVHLQWKKIGTYVTEWTINPGVGTGFSGGCTLVVAAQHTSLWYTQPLVPVSISQPLEWEAVMSVTVTITSNTTVRILYHVPVRPDVLPVDGAGYALDEIDTIIDINGSRYRESTASLMTQAKFSQPGLLMGDMSVTLVPDTYVVTLYWRLNSPTGRLWRSLPSLYDGFMMGRLLAVIGETLNDIEKVSTDSTIFSGVPSPQWFDVGSPLTFFLGETSNVLLRYHLPIQFLHHPSFLSFNQMNDGDVATRLLVDNQPYRSTGSTASGVSRGIQNTEGSMVLSLRPGSHVIRLQWQYEEGLDAQDMLTILNHISNGNQLVALSVQIDSWVDNPMLTAPTKISGLQNQALVVAPAITVQDANPATVVEINYAVIVTFAVVKGVLAIPNPSPGVTFLAPSTVRGRMSDINSALAALTYTPPPMWFGTDYLTLGVKDANVYSLDPVMDNITTVEIDIAHVPSPLVILVPAIPTSVVEDGSVAIQGLQIQGDFNSLSDNGLIPQQIALALRVTNGLLKLGSTTNLIFLIGTGTADSMIQIQGNVTDINNAISAIQYVPDEEYNSLQHVEILDVTVKDIKNQLTTRASVAIHVSDQNDPSTVDVTSPGILLQGYTLQYSGTIPIYVRIQAQSSRGQLNLPLASNVNFITGSPMTRSQSLVLFGLIADLQNALQQISYTRTGSFYGNEMISIESSTSSTFATSDLSYLQLQLSKTQSTPVVQLSTISPSHAISTGGTTINLVGVGLNVTGLACQFGSGDIVGLTSQTFNHATCLAPPSQSTKDTFLVITNGLSVWSNALRFSYDGIVFSESHF
ncbi:Aste57867_20989 [Aphanomyces stellatus]|uniref:Aste57867_20989 protein n=1 Tax=Aphanomyces stellatus TaxID=120398 RepID=A0A485LH41_9STRA|nr:hypothetical protein As57867_020921 [Aphanomyces stellatus]VFT97664.1 Aste57867_20989 [Aphanomyces stellatus]